MLYTRNSISNFFRGLARSSQIEIERIRIYLDAKFTNRENQGENMSHKNGLYHVPVVEIYLSGVFLFFILWRMGKNKA